MTGKASRLLEKLSMFGGKLGLEAITALLARLGNPDDQVPFVLVAGTNGKGSTSAMLCAIANTAGYRVGLYTSPHLETPEERIRVDGNSIPTPLFGDLLEEVIETNRREFGVLPSYFEATTAVARLYFARQKCDLAIMEVGLGGRLDATNTGDPVLSVITSISFDHQLHLGDRLEQIAFEKAGILRPGVPAVLWMEPSAVGDALLARADELRSPVIDATLLSSAFASTASSDDAKAAHQRCEVITPGASYDLELALLGEHQLRNLRIAVLAAEQLSAVGFTAIDHGAIERGVARCRWPGRLERVVLQRSDADPAMEPITVLLDGAHNEGGALALASYLDRLGEDFVLLFGCLERKEVDKILPPLARRARRIVLTAPLGGEAHPPASLRDLLAAIPEIEAPVTVVDLPEAALDMALASVDQDPTGSERPRLILACGSLYLVGNLRPLLYRRFGVPPPAALTPILTPD